MRRGRVALTLLLVACFFLTAAVRDMVYDAHQRLVAPRANVGQLNNLNSFSLALFLGGLRGPLVMYLWPSIENQKAQRDLEDIDTKIEMVRLLQAEFDSVHLFQIWNKAYNLSVQMASKPNKYSAVLSAMDYAEQVNREKPDDINIVSAIAGLYFDKFGKSEEAKYYNERLRRETLPHEDQRTGRAAERNRHRAMLDSKGHIDPQFKQELQYLAPYDTADFGFADGLSPFALAYNYFMRARVLHSEFGQKHLQMSDYVIETRPAIALRTWGEELWDRGLADELKAFGKSAQTDRALIQPMTQDVALDQKPVDPAAIDEAVKYYDRARRLAGDAIAEYNQMKTGVNYQTYKSHTTQMDAQVHMNTADAAYLRAMSASDGTKAELLASAAKEYQASIDAWFKIIFTYYVEDDIVREVYPPMPDGSRYSKATIEGYDAKNYPALFKLVMDAMDRRFDRYKKAGKHVEDLHVSERMEFHFYIDRAEHRLAQIKLATGGNRG